MANSDYSYAQVKSGNGTYKYEGPSASYSDGVKTLQTRLSNCGYILSIDGYFAASTRLAVRRFQRTIFGMSSSSVDGVVGKNTLTALDAVYQSDAFKYGSSICSDSSLWTRNTLATSGWWNTTDKRIDALARVIFAEDNDNNNARQGVARVIYNRSSRSAFKNPNASNKWMGVITCESQYSTVPSSAWTCDMSDGYDAWPSDGTKQRALVPRRGSSSGSYINAAWDNAVSLAKALVNGSAISTALGYPITYNSNGSVTVGSTANRSMSSNHLYQVNYSKFLDWINKGYTMTEVLNYTGDKDGNVFLVR